MKIIKKNGSIQEFDLNKICTSIIRAAEDIGIYVNQSDINILTHDIQNKLQTLHRKETSSYEIFGLTLQILIENGYKDIALSYLNGLIQI